MSLWTDARVKELLTRVAELERRLDANDAPMADVIGDTPEYIHSLYIAKFGKPPHHRMKLENIKEALK